MATSKKRIDLDMFYISGTGKAIPSQIVTNDDLALYLDTNDEWITSRTGIKERRILKDHTENTVTLSAAAALEAMKNANLKAEDIDCVIVATASPIQPIPSTANLVAEMLGINGPAFDINAACSGFVYGLTVASGFFAQNMYQNVLLIGADSLSTFIDKHDRSTVILFGDGAGAVTLSATNNPDAGLIGIDLGGDSSLAPILEVRNQKDPEIVEKAASHLTMNGQEVFKVAVRAVEKSIASTLEKANIKGTEVDWLLLHQANVRIIDAICERLDIDRDKALTNIDKYGNTSAASIPLLLAEVAETNRFKDGDLLAFCGFGAGMTWGTCILRWFNSK
ncbi:MAG TPA: beta-ketoacyl-ACP synthase III [Acidimicrobiia bacterium]|nr:beta-ketoacyl-ACP synthase III [Acidimicrobiia bacterium]